MLVACAARPGIALGETPRSEAQVAQESVWDGVSVFCVRTELFYAWLGMQTSQLLRACDSPHPGRLGCTPHKTWLISFLL